MKYLVKYLTMLVNIILLYVPITAFLFVPELCPQRSPALIVSVHDVMQRLEEASIESAGHVALMAYDNRGIFFSGVPSPLADDLFFTSVDILKSDVAFRTLLWLSGSTR